MDEAILRETLRDIHSILEDIKRDLVATRVSHTEVKTRMETLPERVKSIDAELASLRSDLTALQNSLTSLRTINEQSDKNKNTNSNIINIVIATIAAVTSVFALLSAK